MRNLIYRLCSYQHIGSFLIPSSRLPSHLGIWTSVSVTRNLCFAIFSCRNIRTSFLAPREKIISFRLIFLKIIWIHLAITTLLHPHLSRSSDPRPTLSLFIDHRLWTSWQSHSETHCLSCRHRITWIYGGIILLIGVLGFSSLYVTSSI